MAKYTIDQIIDAGRRSFAKYGDDFRMSDVAKELDTKASSLYRHVATKRELYFAMLTKEFDEFGLIIGDIVSKLVNPVPADIIKSIAQYILKMAREEPEQFVLMFMTSPPEPGPKLAEESLEPGPYEKACNPTTIGQMQDLIGQHMMLNEQDMSNLSNVTFYLISLIVGAGIVSSPAYEYSSQGLLPRENYEEFHEFVIENSLKLWSVQS